LQLIFLFYAHRYFLMNERWTRACQIPSSRFKGQEAKGRRAS
jgi:hypothetical protein